MRKNKEPKTVSFKKYAKYEVFAAYSDVPFEEAEKDHPDFAFWQTQKTYWVARIGELHVPWGFGCDECGFYANGVIKLCLGNKQAALDGKGFRYKQEANGVWYLYQSVLTDSGFDGFIITLRDEFLPILKEIAKEAKTPEAFKEALKTFGAREDVKRILSQDLAGRFELFGDEPIRIDGSGVETK